jgi:soluble lytic murein transglycosylase-like protein
MRVRAFLLAVLVLALFPVAAWANYPHVVTPGETLTSVAAADGLSIDAIAAANGISPNAELVTGQVLWIPPRTLASMGTAAGETAKSTYTSSSTSSSSSTSTSTAATTATSADDEQAEESAETGEQSTTSTTHTENTAYTQAKSTTTTATSGSSTAVGAPQPTAERVSGSEIASIAQANGVPAGLAEAVAWQESGWNNAEVSGIGAVGVMQIVPSTWSWIDRYLTPSNPLGTASAAENVRGGVLLLHQLLQLTGGNESLAVAGYYQGLASVQAHGMYASTRQYVADVLALAQRLGG